MGPQDQRRRQSRYLDARVKRPAGSRIADRARDHMIIGFRERKVLGRRIAGDNRYRRGLRLIVILPGMNIVGALGGVKRIEAVV